MTTNKPEVVAYRYKSSRTYCSNRKSKWHYQESLPVSGSRAVQDLGVMERLIRLSDYEALQAECEKLRKDASRLDWLADPENEIGEVLLPTEVVEQNPHSMRDAIDAAMEIDQ